MKKIVAVIIIAVVVIVTIVGCNKQVIDVTYSYESAILSLPDGTIISGRVSSWKDYDDGDQIQVKIDGKQYLIHSSNIVLISE